jgi:predicted O-methyltransferase YrrM/mannosyltransferase OCH1-like enzyme
MEFIDKCEELKKLYNQDINDGNISQIPLQLDKIKEILDVINPKNILEVGFGLGISSLFFLMNSNTNVVSFDTFTDEYHKIGKKYIDSNFPNRHKIIQGNSEETLDLFIDECNDKFDIIFIDGGRDNAPYSDLVKCANFATSSSIIIINNIVRKTENYAFWNVGFNNALNVMINNNWFKELDQFDYFFGRGMATGRYLFDKNDKPLSLYCHYKNMNKVEMFRNIENKFNVFYLKNKAKTILNSIKILCESYLDYFEKIDEEDTYKVEYYYGMLNKSNPEIAISIFEKLLNYENKKISNDLISKVKEELRLLYPKSNINEIPKIIHLLFFGETDFCSYHYRCITSMINNMPNHKIIIYNNIEPINNSYWDLIKKSNQVTIEKIIPPDSFDGFQLKYFQYKADVVRIEKLYEHGGIYLDIDMLIFKNFERIFDSKHDFYISKENKDGDGLINAFIASKPKNEFLKIWLDSFKTGLRMNVWAYHIRDANARLLKENPQYYLKYNICVLDSEEFFSFKWTDTNAFESLNSETQLGENVYGIHLFETILNHVILANPFLTTIYPISSENIVLEIGVTHSQKICTLNNFVDEIIVLSLNQRPEKTEYIKNHLDSLGIKYSLMMNDLHWSPSIGCFESHINAIKYAKTKNMKNVLIFEDDILIQNIDILNNLSKDLPEHWDILYLGGILTNNYFTYKSWIRGIIWCNHAYIVNSKMYDIILEKFNQCNLEEYAMKRETIDHFYTRHINSDYNCFLQTEQPIVQREGYSDLSKKLKWTNFNWDTYSLKNLSDL